MRSLEVLVLHLRVLRESGDVQRCHTSPHHGDTSLARHQWGLASLAFALVPPETLSLKLVRACLLHDVHERWTGDMPRFAKTASYKTEESLAQTLLWDKLSQRNPEQGLSSEEKLWLEFLDVADFCLWASSQVGMGAGSWRRDLKQALAYLKTGFYNLNHLMVSQVVERVCHCLSSGDVLPDQIELLK